MVMIHAVAPSNINLVLKVIRRRQDGYHEIESLFVPFQEPGDELQLEIIDDNTNAISLTPDTALVPSDLSNLAGRAAAEYCRTAGITDSIAIRLKKRIPVAAGMGGGSADAATVLSTLQKYYCALSEKALAALALSLGADVPFFLRPEPAICRGIGEIFEPLGKGFPPLPALIVNPGFPIRAAWAYQHADPSRFGELPSFHLPELLQAWRANDFEGVAHLLHNDLAFGCYAKFPILRLIRDFLLRSGAVGVNITGSGPTIFAIASNSNEAGRICTEVQSAFPFCFSCCLQQYKIGKADC